MILPAYLLADSLDGDSSINSAKLVVESIIRDFTEVPSMGKGRLKRMAHRAHTELLRQKAGMHLKASAVVAVTDYQKIRYVYVGNSRYYLIRNDRILEKTTDQSLTSNLVEAEKITLDQAAAHEERNNLYSFLGERGTPKIQISKKRKLENGDVFLLLTRGVWEQCPDEKLLEIIRDAKEPEEVLYRTEDMILVAAGHLRDRQLYDGSYLCPKSVSVTEKAVELQEDTHGCHSYRAGGRRHRHGTVS